MEKTAVICLTIIALVCLLTDTHLFRWIKAFVLGKTTRAASTFNIEACWHTVDEEPDDFTDIVVILDEGIKRSVTKITWNPKYGFSDKVIAWAYFDIIAPNYYINILARK